MRSIYNRACISSCVCLIVVCASSFSVLFTQACSGHDRAQPQTWVWEEWIVSKCQHGNDLHLCVILNRLGNPSEQTERALSGYLIWADICRDCVYFLLFNLQYWPSLFKRAGLTITFTQLNQFVSGNIQNQSIARRHQLEWVCRRACESLGNRQASC